MYLFSDIRIAFITVRVQINIEKIISIQFFISLLLAFNRFVSVVIYKQCLFIGMVILSLIEPIVYTRIKLLEKIKISTCKHDTVPIFLNRQRLKSYPRENSR